MCDIAPLQYTTKRSDLATCSMPSYESGRKNCANHAVFLCPVVGGGQHKASAADSWQDSGGEWCSGQQLSEPATADGLLLPCALLDAQSGAFLQQAFGCGRTGDSHNSGFEIGAQLALGGAWCSR